MAVALRPDVDHLLDALAEPALLVSAQGEVLRANAKATDSAGQLLVGQNLRDFAADQSDALLTYLARCSGSRGLLAGIIFLLDRDGVKKYRCHGSMVEIDRQRQIFIRCTEFLGERFSVLTQRMREQNLEIHEHRRTRAILEESLRERELLIREVHHRVKNNIKILQGMLSTAARNADHPQAQVILEDAVRRLAAIASVQQVLYRADQPTSYPAEQFVSTLIESLQSTWPASPPIEYHADPVSLLTDMATPLALIINELLTNAVKHASGDKSDSIEVSLKAVDGEIEIVVQDRGPGFHLGEVKSRASGLGLVRGLTRQLGGSFTVENRLGARCVVRFPHTLTVQT